MRASRIAWLAPCWGIRRGSWLRFHGVSMGFSWIWVGLDGFCGPQEAVTHACATQMWAVTLSRDRLLLWQAWVYAVVT